MFNLLSKLLFLKRKPKVIVVAGENVDLVSDAIAYVLRNFFNVGKVSGSIPKVEEVLRNRILIFSLSLKNIAAAKKIKFWLERSSQPILLVNTLEEIPPWVSPKEVVFASEKSEEIEDLAEVLPSFGRLILNFDDETVRSIGDKLNVHNLTFGFGEGATLRATNCHQTRNGANFKLNFKGNVLPVWLQGLFGKKNIYSVLGALSIAHVFNLNLVEVSQTLRNWQGKEGEGKLVEGIKETFLIDDSKNAEVFSMVEMLKVLGEMDSQAEDRRKIALLGDILGIGKYTIEVHEAIGETVAKNADILFTVGQRAKFIAKGAREKGMDLDKIFEFDRTPQAVIALKNEIKTGDIILIDGSTEMKTQDIVKQIKKEG